MLPAAETGADTTQRSSQDAFLHREAVARVALTAGSRHGAKRYAAPELHRPDRPNPFGAVAAWNGQVVEVYGRNSRPTLRGNARSFVQLDDFPRELLTNGYAVRINDEQGISGKRIEAAERKSNRVVLQGIIARLIARESHAIAVVELSRLTRDESGHDPAYLKTVIRQHCNGRIITRLQILDLNDETDNQTYDLECKLAGWRRQDDVAKSMEGYRRYIEDVVAGRREVCAPHRLSFGYRREPITDGCGRVETFANGKMRTKLVLDQALKETMEAFRCAANMHSDSSRLARELNHARLPGPNRYRPIGQQWSRQVIRRLINQDIYAGVWRPGLRFDSEEIEKYLVQNGFNPAEQCRVEPGLAWFTRAELDYWRTKFSDKKKINRTRKYEHSLLGLLACTDCSERLGKPVFLTRMGQQRISKTRGEENIYSCPERQRGNCTYGVAEGSALGALAREIPAIQQRTSELLRGFADRAADETFPRLRQVILAKENRRKWIDENLIQPCMAAGVKVDVKHVVEHARLGEEIDTLRRELDALGGRTEAPARSAELLRAFDGRLDQAIPLMNAREQAIVYTALLAIAYIGGTGKGRGKINSIRSFQTVAESGVYAQDSTNGG